MLRHRTLLNITRQYSNLCFRNIIQNTKISDPDLQRDINDLVRYFNDIQQHMLARKEETLYKELLSLLSHVDQNDGKCQEPTNELVEAMEKLALKLPNKVHPDIINYENDFKIVKVHGEKKSYSFHPLSGTQLLKEKDLLKMSGLNYYCGDRSYYFVYETAKVEKSLIDFVLHKLLERNFTLISVPDILPDSIIEGCGMPTKDTRTQIFKLDPLIYGDGWCLSGTSEMAIAAFFMNKKLKKDSLPLYFTAVSRCYRAEISELATEKGLYRVHQFTKIEMFAICLPEQSDNVQRFLCAIQEELFTAFNLHYRVIDMAAHELGRQAYRKYDIEAWMPGSDKYGEISSCSNCLDYQARRLNIRTEDGEYVHTVNGTACAVPRTLNAIVETHQIDAGRIVIPAVLRPLCGFNILGMKRGPNSQIIKSVPGNLSRYTIF